MADAIEKLESAMRKRTNDVGELRAVRKGERVCQDAPRAGLKEVREVNVDWRERQKELLMGLKNIQETQTALTNAMTSALKQLGADKAA